MLGINLTSLPAYKNSSIPMNDVQGLILKGYNFPNIRYIIFNVKDTEGARKFCADLVDGSGPGGMKITDAVPWKGNVKPEYCLNIGFTYFGLEAVLGSENTTTVADYSFTPFSSFTDGAVADALNIGDIDESAPENWWQNGGWLSKEPPAKDGSDLHIQITLFTQTPQNREKYYETLLGMIPKAGTEPSVVPVFFQDSDPVTVDGHDDYIHFGYRDSLSQPRIDESFWEKPEVKRLMGDMTKDDRPVVPADRFLISQDATDYGAHPLLTNGTFAAFRLLYQDEEKFNAFINSGDMPAELLAAKMCGRWRNGVPLTISPDTEDFDLGEPGPKNFNFTNFDYLKASPNQQGNQDGDTSGLKCPYASHIRRANPRDDSKVTGNNDDAKTHRILRRASPYGLVYNPPENGEVQRGLVGLFINAILDYQFRFVTMQWFNLGGFRNPDASPNISGIDPLFGMQKHDATPALDSEFAFNDNGTYKVVPKKLERFVRTDGSLYLFLPSISALKYISEGEIPPVE